MRPTRSARSATAVQAIVQARNKGSISSDTTINSLGHPTMSQFGSLAAIGTPLDQHLADLNARLGTDDVPYVRSPIKSFIVNRLYSHHQTFSVRAQVLSGCDAFLRTALATPGIFRQDAEASELQTLRSRSA